MKSSYERALSAAKKAKPDLKLAKSLLEDATSSGDHRATYALAAWYLHGKPPLIEKNVKKAAQLLKAAAVAGNAKASFDYAVSLERGIGIKKSEILAFRYYLQSALLGDVDAMGAVGRMYYHGLGVVKERKIAWIWLDHHRSLVQSKRRLRKSTERG